MNSATLLATPVALVAASTLRIPRLLRGWLHAAAACRVQLWRDAACTLAISGPLPIGASERIWFGHDSDPADFWECTTANDPLYINSTADTQIYGEIYWEDKA